MEEKLAKIHRDLLDLAEVIYIIGKLKNGVSYVDYMAYIMGFVYDDIAGIDREICQIISEIQENKGNNKERGNEGKIIKDAL